MKKSVKKSTKKNASLFNLAASAALLPVLVSRWRRAKASRDKLEVLDVVASASVVGVGVAKALRTRRQAKKGTGATNG